jgi:hypothetical protein
MEEGNNCWKASAGLPFGAILLGDDMGGSVDMQTPSAMIAPASYCDFCALTSAAAAELLSDDFLLSMLSVT